MNERNIKNLLQGVERLLQAIDRLEITTGGVSTGLASETTLGNLLTELQAKADLTETQPVEIVQGSTSTISTIDTSLAAITSSQSLIASNANRKQLLIHNDSTLKVYIAIGSAASSTNFSFALAPNGSYLLDYTPEELFVISASGATGTGLISVTETV